MQRQLCLIVLLVVAMLATAASAQDAKKKRNARQWPPELPGSRTEVYKTVGDTKLNIYMYEPAGHKPSGERPAIVFFFGGGWRNGSPAQFEEHCKHFASRGMVAMTADYRVASRQNVQAKECVADAKSAVRWIRANAERLGVDPNRIAAGGGSAGGHIAACTGIIKGWEGTGEDTSISSVPNALVLFNPAAAFKADPSVGFDEEAYKGLAERMGTDPRDLSPAHHVEAKAPPTIMFFGTDDRLLGGAQMLHEKMLKAGNRCELKTWEGQGHGFFNHGRGDGKMYTETLNAADAFLVSLGWIK